jgi:signal transduction histidine kinase/ligand-binding sensor domain-containing protein
MRDVLLRFFIVLAAVMPALAAPGRGGADAAPPPRAVEYVSRSWLTDDGLPYNVVSRVEQDSTGYLWLATMAGLTRFDGREFKVFALPGESATRGHNIRDFAILPDGTILFLPAQGGVLEVRHDLITKHPLSQQLGNEPLLQIFAESGGAIWLEAGTGLARWKNGHLERFGDAEGINRRSQHFSWATDERGRIWVAGADFLGFYRDGHLVRTEVPAGTIYRVAPSRTGGVWVYGNGLYKCIDEKLVRVASAPWPGDRASARCLFEDRAGGLWVATSRLGVFHFDGQTFAAIPNVEPGVEFVTEDREGDIWLATDGGGIRRLRPKAFTLVDAPVTSVAADSEGAVWFAGLAAGIIRQSTGGMDVFPARVGRVPVHVVAVCADAAGQLWVSTTSGIFRCATRDPAHLHRVDSSLKAAHVLFADARGLVWVAAGSRFGYFREDTFHPVKGLAAGDEVTAMGERPGGQLWVGTLRGGVYANTGENLTPVRLAGVNGTVHAFLSEADGSCWIGTAAGLVFVGDGQIRRFTPAEGLPDGGIMELLPDTIGNLWIATPRGLFRLSRSELLARDATGGPRINAVAYGAEQGLVGISPITSENPTTCRDAAGTLWFCTYKGGIGIDPSRVPRDLVPPPVLVKEVRLGDRTVDPRPGLRISPGADRLEFRLAVLSFSAPQRVQIRHQLVGFDDDWIDTPPDRVARYTRLPPGDYRLKVTACNSEGIWNRTGAELAFIVLPAWWQTLWFRAAAVLGFAAIVGAAVRFWAHRKLRARLDRLEREHALEQERARIARDMHDELGGSVTSINLAVQRLRDLPGAGANGVVDVLDRRVRRLSVELDRVVWTVSPKHGSLEQLAAFIERFAQSLLKDSGVACRVHGGGNIPPWPVGPDIQHHVLAVTKEAINNVVKHARATAVVIELAVREQDFAVTIQDNGIGFDPIAPEYSDRNGLQNMRTRIAALRGTLAFRIAEGGGTAVCLQVPVVRPVPT